MCIHEKKCAEFDKENDCDLVYNEVPNCFENKSEASKTQHPISYTEFTCCAQEALVTLKEFNRLRNDTDAYLHQITLWGLGVMPTKPDPKDYGI